MSKSCIWLVLLNFPGKCVLIISTSLGHRTSGLNGRLDRMARTHTIDMSLISGGTVNYVDFINICFIVLTTWHKNEGKLTKVSLIYSWWMTYKIIIAIWRCIKMVSTYVHQIHLLFLPGYHHVLDHLQSHHRLYLQSHHRVRHHLDHQNLFRLHGHLLFHLYHQLKFKWPMNQLISCTMYMDKIQTIL